VGVAVFEARQDGSAVEIDAARGWAGCFGDVGERSDGEEAIAADGDGFGGRMPVPHSNDVAVVIDRVSLGIGLRGGPRLLAGQREGLGDRDRNRACELSGVRHQK
jgi:hypothetical protein